jgi:Cdc6-like AAA superfamily ATPase
MNAKRSSKPQSADINTNPIILHELFSAALARLGQAYDSRDNLSEPVCFAITGPSGSGKTVLVKTFSAEHPPKKLDDGWIREVLVVETPVRPTLKGIAAAVLQALGDPCFASGTEVQMTERVIRLMASQRTRFLIFEEFQHLLERDSLKLHHETADWLKALIDATGVPTVVVGLPYSEDILTVNEQLRRRFQSSVPLEAFDWNQPKSKRRYVSFLKEISKVYAFDEDCDLSDISLAYRLYCASGGLVGYIFKIVRYATDLARLENADGITMDHLRDAYTYTVWQDVKGAVNPFCDTLAPEDVKKALQAVRPVDRVAERRNEQRIARRSKASDKAGIRPDRKL